MAACPDCVTQVNVSAGTKAGEIVFCPQCNAELEVISVDPMDLAIAPEVEEDWGE